MKKESIEFEWILVTDPQVADSPITAMSFDDPNWITTCKRREIERHARLCGGGV